MLFNSWQYIVFLPIVFICYWALPHKIRWAPLLFASYYFYMSWSADLILLIATTTLTSYFAALMIERSSQKATKKIWLFTGCSISLGLLLFFKYFNFFSQTVVDALRYFSLPTDNFTLQVMLPVGISFYTFQTLSYVIDVYKGELSAERHLGIFALYVSFFPQLVAGPIERAQNLLPQFHRRHTFSATKCSWGLRMIVFGLLKKMFIADYFAGFSNAVFNAPYEHTPMSIFVATMFFSVQIYCDFSGYSNVARGSAAILGFDLMLNFNTPFFSRSIKEFWQRWHISLSTFFRDYIYIPLGGSKKGNIFRYRNIVITFLISGLWHGAAWTFVLWGALHGIVQVVEDLFRRADFAKNLRSKLPSFLKSGFQILAVFLVVCTGWTLFRANSMQEGLYMLFQLPKIVVFPLANLQNTITTLQIGAPQLAKIVFSLSLLFVYDFLQYRGKDPFTLLAQKPAIIRYGVSYGLAFLCMYVFLTVPSGAVAEFIYFQF